MNKYIAIVSDMIFATRITGTAEKFGAECKIVINLNALQDALELEKPGTVLVDMNCDGITPEVVIRKVKSHNPNIPVVAFFSHVQGELKERAIAAGADYVWPRSTFVQRLPQLLEDVRANIEQD